MTKTNENVLTLEIHSLQLPASIFFFDLSLRHSSSLLSLPLLSFPFSPLLFQAFLLPSFTLTMPTKWQWLRNYSGEQEAGRSAI